MAKGDDAIRRKQNKTKRKRLRNSENAVSARVASIIASKKRRKSGKRRICEGMCFSLPTPDDPFNDRLTNKKPVDKPKSKQPNKNPNPTQKETMGPDDAEFDPKYLIMCLNEIQKAWRAQERKEEETTLMGSKWGPEFRFRCSSKWNVVDCSGHVASDEQLAWLLCTAADIMAKKEEQGQVLDSPFLLFLVPTQERASQVREVCKPLKAMGIHTVSLHPGASIHHQIQGLKKVQPEFLISTPDRLHELVQLGVINVSSVSMLVLDGLKILVDLGFSDKVKSIKECISGKPQTAVFCDSYEETIRLLLQSLLRGPVCRLSLAESVVCRSAFISQSIQVYSTENEKMSKAIQILTQAFVDQKLSWRPKILLVGGSTFNAHMLASQLKAEGYGITGDLHEGLYMTNGEKVSEIILKDIDSAREMEIGEFEIVILLDCPSEEDYVAILSDTARYSIAGSVYCFLAKADAGLSPSFLKVLKQCEQDSSSCRPKRF